MVLFDYKVILRPGMSNQRPFKDFKIFKLEKNIFSFNIFSSPFNIDVETVPDELQMELIELQTTRI